MERRRRARSGRGSSTRSSATRSSRSVPAGGLLVFLSIPAFSLHTANPSVETLPQDLVGDPDLQPDPGGLPRRPDPGHRRGQRRRRAAHPRSTAAIAELRERGRFAAGTSSSRSRPTSAPTAPSPRSASRWRETAATRESTAALAALRDELIPATVGAVPGVTADVTGYTAELGGLHRHAEVARAAGVRLRAHGGVHPAAVHLPLDRDPDQGDPAQPALGRSGLRDPRLDLPGGPPRGAARLRVERGDRLLDADLPVRGPVRALDGLPRVHPHPDPRGLRPRDADATRRSRTGSRPPRAWSPAPRW